MSYDLNQLRGAWGAGYRAAESKQNDPTGDAKSARRSGDPLIGKYFHSIKGGRIWWQGKVLERQPDGLYLVQLYEWLLGQPSSQRLVNVRDMTDWKFYSNRDAWVDAGDRSLGETK